jgi:polysaccharide pyruvyl transferase WcaK-like protein
MRTLILNDARTENHIGCVLVMENLLRLCGKNGLAVVGTVSHSVNDDQAEVLRRADDFDLLLVNGEGTLHHDRPKALELCRAASQAAMLGKKVVLLNTVWQDNHELNRHLRSFDLIFCRESRSQAAIQAAGRRPQVVPDLVFATEIVSKNVETRRTARATAIIDSVDRQTTLTWAWRALRQGHGFLPMHEGHCRLLQRRPWLNLGIGARSGFAVKRLGIDWANQLCRFDRVISGRYHGCCLAMLLGKPVLGIPSNTQKNQALFEDAGLGEESLLYSGAPLDLERRFHVAISKTDKVHAYVRQAKHKIASMFDQIRQLA